MLTFKITLSNEQRNYFYENHFIEFYQSQDEKVKEKMKYVLELIKQVDKVPEKFLKHLRGQTDFMKLELNISQIFTEYFVALIKGNW